MNRIYELLKADALSTGLRSTYNPESLKLPLGIYRYVNGYKLTSNEQSRRRLNIPNWVTDDIYKLRLETGQGTFAINPKGGFWVEKYISDSPEDYKLLIGNEPYLFQIPCIRSYISERNI